MRGIVAVVVAATSVLGVTASAQADRHPGAPTRSEVEHAKAVVAQRTRDVASLQAQLVVANDALQAAGEKAEMAAEAYNGAMYRLQQAKAQTAQAKADAAKAAQNVESERAGIAALVTQGAQDGSSLAGVTAFLGADSIDGVMNRVAAVNSAADSMQARFDQFTAMNALARVAQAKAEKAVQAETKLTKKAATLRAQAAQAANDAQTKASQIGAQRTELVHQLAAAQKISVKLAAQRQRHLEKVAEARAAAAAEAKAKHDAEEATKNSSSHEDENLPEEGGWDLPGLSSPDGTADGAAKAIKFAKAQLGDPYVWAAAGPDRWDCSGLTMMAWKAGGVALPHYSAAQYQLTVHIGVGDLRPGDLVFWGTSPNTIHHVAMYIGDGKIIQAPRTGSYVEISGMYDWIPPNFFGRP
ncbi:NlpC/P60 family protein [Nocardioides marmorisolisilvae]|uniref:NlpC/P60 family protein n=2 Tax=Nocardioides marmorisolisilvae TaxID=1542737 RepID=A0A3N0E060_9ACTN|nr:NlpC/P60 family protein [Nocardioides marmorisolisilvae]